MGKRSATDGAWMLMPAPQPMEVTMHLLELGQPVKVCVYERDRARWRLATVIGRAFMQVPRYDVRMRDGSIELNLPAGRLRPEPVRSHAPDRGTALSA